MEAAFETAHAHLLETALLNAVCATEPILEIVDLAYALYVDAGGKREEFVAVALSAVAEDSLRMRLVYTALFMRLLEADAGPLADASLADAGLADASLADASLGEASGTDE